MKRIALVCLVISVAGCGPEAPRDDIKGVRTGMLADAAFAIASQESNNNCAMKDRRPEIYAIEITCTTPDVHSLLFVAANPKSKKVFAIAYSAQINKEEWFADSIYREYHFKYERSCEAFYAMPNGDLAQACLLDGRGLLSFKNTKFQEG